MSVLWDGDSVETVSGGPVSASEGSGPGRDGWTPKGQTRPVDPIEGREGGVGGPVRSSQSPEVGLSYPSVSSFLFWGLQ